MRREKPPGAHRPRRLLLVLTILCASSGAAAALAAAGTTDAADETVAELRAELAELRRQYDRRIDELERRLAALETSVPEAETQVPAGDEAERLRELARQTAAPVAATPAATAVAGEGGRRSLNRLNPELSVTGIFLGDSSDRGREDFQAEEFELDLQASLDPFSRFRLTLAVGEEEEAEVEEGYVVYSALPAGLGLTAGRFRQSFGPLNRQHLHALPQSEYPPVLTAFFGEEGLAQTGLSLGWLLPRPWASANEVTLQLTDGSSDAFGSDDFERLVLLGRVKSFWELDPARWVEWGVSAVEGGTAAGGTSRVWGSDLTFHWQPPARAKYREITWRTEALYSERDDATGRRQEAWGGYSYLEGTVVRNLSLGLRYDRVEDPLDPGDRSWGVVPYLSWWQSEWVRLRGEYRRVEHDLGDETEDRFVLQLTWAAGPHKHESY